jgi:hypothetical protein
MDRFSFNPQTLSYERICCTGKRKFYRFFIFSGFTLIFSISLLLVRDRHFQSPRSERLTTLQGQVTYELELMNRDIQQYESILANVAFNDDHIYRVYFEVDPWPSTFRNAGVGGSYRDAFLMKKEESDLLMKTYRNMDQIERKLAVQSSSFDQVIQMASTKEERLAARPAIQPLSLKDISNFGSSFGIRFHPILKVMRPHEGIDLTAPRGTSIFATADGKVVQAGFRPGGFGKKILIDHGFGYETLYGHCDQVLVEPGQKVKRGEVIGRVGSTGLSRSPHLHYEVHVNGRPVDPINFYSNDISPEEYDRMIELLSQADPSFDLN